MSESNTKPPPVAESQAVSPQHVPTLHSSSVPLGHGCFFAQSREASSHVVPQKFVVDACTHGDIMIEISEKTKKDDLRILLSYAILFHFVAAPRCIWYWLCPHLQAIWVVVRGVGGAAAHNVGIGSVRSEQDWVVVRGVGGASL